MIDGVKIEQVASNDDKWVSIAQQVYTMYSLFMKAGFTSNQALELTKVIVKDWCR